MARDIVDDTPIENREMLVEYLQQGCKPKEAWRIGTEHEKFPFYLLDHKPVPYGGAKGIEAILSGLQKKLHWHPVLDDGAIIGLLEPEGRGAISLEPGGQFELSGAAVETLHQTCCEVKTHLNYLHDIAGPLGIGFLGLGASPKWSLEETPQMPKSRYAIMRNYMPKVGTQGLDMMYRTATIQVNLDFSDEADMRHKMQVGMKLQPVVTAMFAASPFREGKPCGLLSWRSEIWRDTDKKRTGILPFVFSEDFGFSDYVEWALDVPMYFVIRGGHYHDCTDMTFRSFLEGGYKSKGPAFKPVIGDFVNHLSTLFPEVRLKRFLEMRGADGGAWWKICALPAYWVGLLYDQKALAEVKALVKDWTFEEVEKMRNGVPSYGLNTPFREGTVLDLAKETLAIAKKGLKNRAKLCKRGEDESRFLVPLEEMMSLKITEAEKLLNAYYTVWEEEIDPIFYACAY